MNKVYSYSVEPAYTHEQGFEKIVGGICRSVSYNPYSALLIGSAGIGASLFRFSATYSLISTFFLNSITAIGMATLLGVVYQWKHLPTSLIGVPLLSLFGIQWRHGMGEKQFEERKCFKDHQLIGEIYYEKQKNGDDIPVLELHSKDHYDKGFAHGYLLGKEIDDLFHRVLRPLISLVQVATGDFSGSFYQKQFDQITIPEQYAEELRGALAGVKAYAKDRGYETDLTEEDAHSAHKITDIYKAILCQRILGFSFINALGCSTAIIKQNDQIAACRTLDWESFDKMGGLTIVRRDQVGNTKTESMIFPGLIHALTSYNNHGLIVIINECGIVSQEGTPYGLLARQIIEKAKTVKEAQAMIDQANFQPASSHHLTIVDCKEGINFQMLVSNKKYLARSLPFKQENECVVLTNHALDEEGQVMEGTIAHSSSKKRFQAMQATVNQGLKENQRLTDIMRQALCAVNTKDTIGAAIYTFQGNQVIREQYAYDNHFAASHLK